MSSLDVLHDYFGALMKIMRLHVLIIQKLSLSINPAEPTPEDSLGALEAEVPMQREKARKHIRFGLRTLTAIGVRAF